MERIVQQHKQPTVFETFSAQVFHPATVPGSHLCMIQSDMWANSAGPSFLDGQGTVSADSYGCCCIPTFSLPLFPSFPSFTCLSPLPSLFLLPPSFSTSSLIHLLPPPSILSTLPPFNSPSLPDGWLNKLPLYLRGFYHKKQRKKWRVEEEVADMTFSVAPFHETHLQSAEIGMC